MPSPSRRQVLELAVKYRDSSRQPNPRGEFGQGFNLALQMVWQDMAGLLSISTENMTITAEGKYANGLKPCGTNAAYMRHKRRGDPYCPPCWAAHAADVKERAHASNS